MKVAFVYNKNHSGLSGNWYCNNSYNFFVRGLPQNSRIRVENIPFERKIDCFSLKGFDVILFYDIRNGQLLNAAKTKSLKIARAPDSHDIDGKWIRLSQDLGIRFVFNHHTKKYARKFLGNKIPYHQIIFGIDKEIYKNYRKSRKKKILLTGIVNNTKFYILRKRCDSLPFVEYVGRNCGFVNNKFPDLLNQYQAAIAACSVTSVYKYFELPMCGCLTFVEVNKDNGCDDLGFKNNVNSIFIDENNYNGKFNEYIQDTNNPKWAQIASAGEEFILSKYENRLQVDKLVDLIYQYV